MTQHERVNVGDLRRVAELANLELTAAEEASMLRDLNSLRNPSSGAVQTPPQ